MSGGEALDLALGLLRAPARRGQLLARPLPAGMTTLLEVAGGSTAAARAASASIGATPAELLEAARFFVQQILFTDDASAYRVLGAGPDAPQATLQAHHRHLQRWLHPDRDGGEAWDSAFSARVNDAWNQLRTPRARRAYDQSRPEHTAPAAPADAEWPSRPAAPASGWHPPTANALAEAPSSPPRSPRRLAGPLAVLAIAVACGWLLWMVQQRDGREHADLFPPTPVLAPAPPVVPATPVGRPHAADAGDAEIRGERGDVLVAERRGRSPDLQAPPHTPIAPVGRPHAADAPVGRPYAADAGDAEIRGERGDVLVAGRRGRSPDLREPPAAPDVPATPAVAPTVASTPATVVPAPLPHATVVPAPPPDAAVAPVGRPYAADARDAEIRGERGDVLVAERRGRGPDLQELDVAATAASAGPATIDTPGVAPTPESLPDSFLLFQQAEHTAAQATAYLASDGSHIPPIWNDFATEAAAADARARLSLRLEGRDPRELRLGSPQWRMDGERAVLDAGYRIGGWRTRESGLIHIEMTRREQRWLVTHLTLEPSA